jgi:hypothetical protein
LSPAVVAFRRMSIVIAEVAGPPMMASLA